ncbi:Nucleotide sugar dehydrogenase [Gammaproteobacteria bacterium]
MIKNKKISIIGGSGHVGLPLGVVLAEVGWSVGLVDINQNNNILVNKGIFPFLEYGDGGDSANETLKKVVSANRLFATDDLAKVAESEIVFFVTGTLLDECLNPRINDVVKVVEEYLPYLNNNQLIILRSTVCLGVVEIIEALLTKRLGKHKLAYCPERVAQGHGISEIKELPQIIAATSFEAEQEAVKLFSSITSMTIVLKPDEAELAKLMTNTWRYIEFAIANQFYVIAESKQLDFYKIYDTIKTGYPRAKHFASPGLTGGPCLFKDTMQISAFRDRFFPLVHAAILVNEELPVFLVKQMEDKLISLKDKKIAILGMSFKANNDDKRGSLSYKIKKTLEAKSAQVLLSDVFDDSLLAYDDAISKADGVILGVPHKEYINLKVNIPFVDCWGVWRSREKQE